VTYPSSETPSGVRLDEYRMLAIEQRSASLLADGRAREAVPDLEWAVRRYPLREAMSVSLATARHRSGASVDALRVLRAHERSLAELGLEPSPALRSLEIEIVQSANAAVAVRRRTA